jgi:translation initiation factor eIF-2B subunit delta
MQEIQFKEERLQEMFADRSHGAAQMARAALQVLADYSGLCEAVNQQELIDKLCAYAAELQRARPSMMPVENLLNLWCIHVRALAGRAVDATRLEARDYAYELIRESHDAVSRIAEYAAALIPADSVVMTHTLSSTILECFSLLGAKNVTAIITESRPGYEGRLLAEKLVETAVTAHYITDAQMGLFVSQADFVLVGADSIMGDGSVVNKAGTYLLALAADNEEVPFYVCAETYKHTSRPATEIELEEKPGIELGLPTLPHITPRNIYFDITPPALVKGWISEEGINTEFYE